MCACVHVCVCKMKEGHIRGGCMCVGGCVVCVWFHRLAIKCVWGWVSVYVYGFIEWL